MSVHRVKSSPRNQTDGEEVIWSVDFGDFGMTTVSSPVAKVYDITGLDLNGADVAETGTLVTTTVLPTNTPSASGDTVTLDALQALTAGHLYRVWVEAVESGNTLQAYFDVGPVLASGG